MLWGQRIKVFTDNKNLVRDALGLTCDRVYRWRLLLEEYEPEIVFIKGVDNIVADAISRLEYDPEINVKDINVHQKCLALAKLFNQTEQKLGGDDSNFNESYQQDSEIESDTTSSNVDKRKDTVLQHIFATTTEEEDDIYPPTITEISITQRKNRVYKPYFSNKPFKKKDKKISLKLIDDTDVLVYQDTRLVIPGNAMQNRIITWYHHYLQHPGENRLEETLTAVMYWPGMRTMVRKYVKSCERCQKGKRRKRKYGKIPPKIAQTIPWNAVSVDLIGPYTIKSKDGAILDFMCLTMNDPATGWFEIIELPNASVTVVRKQEEIVEVIIDKSSATVSHLFNKS